MRPEESWCSLCHHSVQSATPVEPRVDGPGVMTNHEPTDPVVVATADRLIAELAAAAADRGRESRLRTLQTKFGVRGGGVVLAVSGGVVLLAIGVLGLTLLGLLL